MTTHFAPASDRQIAFITSLLKDRVVPDEVRDFLDIRISEGSLDSKSASKAIDGLLQSPKGKVKAVKATLPVGMYRKDDTIYRVHESRETGNRYAKRMEYDLYADKPTFVYAKGAMGFLTIEDRMTLDEAKAWGVETGFCCVCGAFLTDAKSVANGIGPVCEKNI